MPQMVSTGVVARDLGISERRVQQLVAEFVLPPPKGGKHDRDLCARRYEVYRDPEGGEWDQMQREAQAEAPAIERLVEAACAPGSTPEMITEASVAHQSAMATLRFCAVVGFRNNEAAKFFALKDIERLDNEAMGGIIHRSLEIMAERSGKPLDEIKARLEADCVALEEKLAGGRHASRAHR